MKRLFECKVIRGLTFLRYVEAIRECTPSTQPKGVHERCVAAISAAGAASSRQSSIRALLATAVATAQGKKRGVGRYLLRDWIANQEGDRAHHAI